MFKAKDFWKYLCDDFNYRLFSGVPCVGLKPLYDTMNPKFMHYMPATSDLTALSLVNGARVAGTKSALLLDSSNFFDITNSIQYYNMTYGIPLLILMYDSGIKLNNIKSSGIKDLDKVIDKVDTTGNTGIVLIKDGDLV